MLQKSQTTFLSAVVAFVRSPAVFCQLCLCVVLLGIPGCSGLCTSFSGGQFISYTSYNNHTNLSSRLPCPRSVSFSFRTRWSPAFIFLSHSGDVSHSLLLTKNGSLRVQYNNGSGFSFMLSSLSNLHDNKWHRVSISLDSNPALLDVDNITDMNRAYIKNAGNMTSVSYVSIGSSGILGGESDQNRAFVGCIADMLLDGLDPLVAACMEQLGFKIHGSMQCTCSDNDLAVVTFTTTRSRLVAPRLMHRNLSFSLWYRTRERNAVLAYSRISGDNRSDSYIAFLLDDGMLRAEIKFNGQCKKQCIPYRSEVDCNDGRWHLIRLATTVTGLVTLSTDKGEYWIPDIHLLNDIFPVGNLLIGSGEGLRYTGLLKHPPVLGFLGCMRDVVVNGVLLDIVGQKDWRDGLVAGCWEVRKDQCKSSLCENGGVCVRGWDRYECDCASGYKGGNCETPVSLLSSTTPSRIDIDVSGHWSEWSGWSAACSDSCDTALEQWRHRRCISGAYCHGQAAQMHSCALSCLDQQSGGYNFSSGTSIHYNYPSSIRPITLFDQIDMVFSTRLRNSLLVLFTLSVNTDQDGYFIISVNVVGKLVVRIGHGDKTLVILTSEANVSNGYQHSVSITRHGAFVSLDINNTDTQSGSTESSDLILLRQDSITVGQSRDPRVSDLSPFSGCFLYLTVNGLDMLSSLQFGSLIAMENDLNDTSHCGGKQQLFSEHTTVTSMVLLTSSSVTLSSDIARDLSSEFSQLTIAVVATGCSVVTLMVVVYFTYRYVKKRRAGVYVTDETEFPERQRSRRSNRSQTRSRNRSTKRRLEDNDGFV